MANEVLVKTGTPQFEFNVTGSYSPADAATNYQVGTPTNVVLTLGALAAGAARQSNKVDLGATRAARYSVDLAIDFTGETGLVSGETVDLYWMPSTSSTAANGNVAGGSGVDAACPNGAVPSGITLAEIILQCQYIGSFVCSDDATVQAAPGIAVFSPNHRYGQMLVFNNTSDPFEAGNVNTAVHLNPLVDEVQ